MRVASRRKLGRGGVGVGVCETPCSPMDADDLISHEEHVADCK